MEGLDRRHDRLDRRLLEVADALEGVAHLGFLLGQLALVGQHLPGRARVRGERLDPVGTGLEELDRVGLGERALGLGDPCPHAVAGHGTAHEDHVALAASHAGATMREPVDAQLELVAPAGAGSCRLDAFHGVLWSQPGYLSLDSIALRMPLRLRLRRS